MTEPKASADDQRKDDRDARRLALWLDDLLQVVAEGTRGGMRRQPVKFGEAGWTEVMDRLANETEATVRMLKQKNARAAARAQQQAKRRGIVKAPKH